MNGDQRTLAGAMFIASARPTDDPTLTDWAGPLMQWHNHGNLCWDRARRHRHGRRHHRRRRQLRPRRQHRRREPDGPRVGHAASVRRVRRARGRRRRPGRRARRPARRHVPGALRTPPTATSTAKPYDPTQPIDLGGVAGVTPEQQAAAENLVALTSSVCRSGRTTRRPRPPASTASATACTGLRALHQVGLDQRRRHARSRPPREPRVPAAARRIEEARQRDVHAARHGGARPTCPTSAAR